MQAGQAELDTNWFWDAVTDDVRDTLTTEQREAISEAAKRRSGQNFPMDVRLTFGKFFLTIVCGKERRGRDRLKTERNKRPVFTLRNLPLIVAVWGSVVYTIFSLVAFSLSGFLGLLA